MASAVPDSGPAWWLVTRKALPGIGGMERLSSELTARLAQRHAVRVVAHAGGRVGLAKFLLDTAGQLKAAVARGEIALLHLGDPVLAPLARIARAHGIPSVVTIHGLDVTHAQPVYRAWRKRFLPDLDAYVCISRAARDAAVAGGVPAERTHVIGIGIEPVAAGTGEREDERLLFVGRLVRRKGLAWFVRKVLPPLAKRRPGVRLVIIGEGPEREDVTAAADATGIGDRLHWLGAVDDQVKHSEFARAAICVMPNIAIPGDLEGYGIVALEAAAAGCPLLAADLEGLRDAVIDGETGRLVPSGDAAAWQAAIDAWLDDGASRHAAGVRAGNVVRAQRGWTPVIDAYAALFESLVARNRGVPSR